MIRVLELFGGIGACTKALERLGIEHEVADYVEIDKYAVKSFNAVHGTNFEPQDICTWDKDIKVDLIMHGSPCQDFSVAGKQAGGDKDSGTRSSLMYETLRIVEKLKPKYVIWENVKNLLSKKHIHNFEAYQEAMRELGYTNYYQVLNAKNYGVPQNRERVFTVSILDGDKYEFPEPFPLDKRLKDVLDKVVDERYYLTDEQTEKLRHNSFNSQRARENTPDSITPTICARDYKGPQCVRLGGLYDKEGNTHQAGSIYDPEGVAATLSTMQGGNQEPLIVASRGRGEKGKLQQHLEPNASGTTNTITSVAKDNYVAEPVKRRRTEYGKSVRKAYENHEVEADEAMREYYVAKDGVMPTLTVSGREQKVAEKTLTTSDNQGTLDGYRIRKLTPKECWRLMGFDDADFEKAEKVNSNSQLYKQAGNSIVVNVLEGILSNLLKEER